MLIHSTDIPLHLENRIIPLTSVDRLSTKGYSFHFGEIFMVLPQFQGQKMTSVVLRSEVKALRDLLEGGLQGLIPARGLKRDFNGDLRDDIL
jgi:hypothetical protein